MCALRLKRHFSMVDLFAAVGNTLQAFIDVDQKRMWALRRPARLAFTSRAEIRDARSQEQTPDCNATGKGNGNAEGGSLF